MRRCVDRPLHDASGIQNSELSAPPPLYNGAVARARNSVQGVSGEVPCGASPRRRGGSETRRAAGREGPASIRSGCGIGYESGKEFREFLGRIQKTEYLVGKGGVIPETAFSSTHCQAVDADWDPCRPGIRVNPAPLLRRQDASPLRPGRRLFLWYFRLTTRQGAWLPFFMLWTGPAGNRGWHCG